MNSSNHYPIWKKVLSSPIIMVVLLIIIFFLSRAVLNVREKSEIINEKMDNANNEYSKLIQRETVLKEKVDFLSTEAGIESELRSKYKAVADGEKVAVILEDREDESTTTTEVTTEKSWWRSFLGIFGI